MARRFTLTVLLGVVLALVAGGQPAGARKASPTVTRPVLSAQPVVSVAFTASGTVRPRATAASRTTVKVTLSAFRHGRWRVVTTGRAALSPAATGTAYARRLAVSSAGRYSVRAYHYRAGKLVAKSPATTFVVARRVTPYATAPMTADTSRATGPSHRNVQTANPASTSTDTRSRSALSLERSIVAMVMDELSAR